jgi:peptidoglycan hydrolase-like protein with peptidoglycan-binding domain
VRSAARSNRSTARDDHEEVVDRRMPRVFILETLGWSHRDAVGCVVAAIATALILVNALFLQSGPHPAPMMKTGLLQTASIATGAGTTAAMQRARPAEAAPVKAAPTAAPALTPRPAAEIILDIQRELGRRGFYDGVADGRYGPKTDAAIRDFESAAKLKPSAEPDEALLRAIRASHLRGRHPAARSALPIHADPIATFLSSNRALADRVRGVQRALADYGYGQINPTGVVDADTAAAIAKFERARHLPITGQVTDRLRRELATITGRPLE